MNSVVFFQFPSGTALDCWSMVTPEEELLILKQFLRFGETRAIVDLMSVERRATSSTLVSFSTSAENKGGSSDVLSRGDSWLVVSSCGSRGHGPVAGGPRSERCAGASTCPLLTSPVPSFVPALKVSNCPALSPTRAQNLRAPSSCPLQRSHSSSSSLCSLPSAQKGRVSCDVCGKSFYDKGSSLTHASNRTRAPS